MEKRKMMDSLDSTIISSHHYHQHHRQQQYQHHYCHQNHYRTTIVFVFTIITTLLIAASNAQQLSNNNGYALQQQQHQQQQQQNYQSNGQQQLPYNSYGPQQSIRYNQRNQQYQFQQNFQKTQAQNEYGKVQRTTGTKFINTPVITTLNSTAGALVQVKLISYNDPNFSLPGGNTCVCPQGQSCPYLTPGIPSCFFSFTIIISAPNQSVQYIASEFVPVSSSPITSGDWTNTHVLNMTAKPVTIDVFVHHLGVVISQSTAILEYFDHLVHVDSFVTSLANYQATPYGSSSPNNVQATEVGQLQGTTLQLAYSVQCIGGKQGPNCDLICTPAPTNNQVFACVSSITGVQSSCTNAYQNVLSCTTCLNGFTNDQTACAGPLVATSTVVGVSPAFRVWTIVLGCLLGLAMIFIILLVIVFIAIQKKKGKTTTPRYVESTYAGGLAPTQPLIYQNDEWRPGKTRATTPGTGSTRSHFTDREPTNDDFVRSYDASNGAAIARREAHV